MKQSTFLAISGGIGVFIGLGMLIFPGQVMEMNGMSLNDSGIMVGRTFGALLFCLGLINVMARHAEDSSALQSILYGNLAVQVLSIILDVMALTSGVVNTNTWGSVVLHILLGAGFANFLFAKPKAA
mgnify:CR=1 FL=1